MVLRLPSLSLSLSLALCDVVHRSIKSVVFSMPALKHWGEGRGLGAFLAAHPEDLLAADLVLNSNGFPLFRSSMWSIS